MNLKLFLVALFLILIDIFFSSDVLTHIAYIMMTYIIANQIQFPLVYQLIVGFFIWVGLVLFHYYLWRKFMLYIGNKYISPDKHKSGLQGKVGRTGKIKKVEGRLYLVIENELYSYTSRTNQNYTSGDEVEIQDVSDTKLIVS